MGAAPERLTRKVAALRFFTGALWLFLPLVAPATITVDFTAQPGQRNVVNASGVALEDENLVLLGRFETGFDIEANAGNFASLSQAFREYGRTRTRTLGGQGGRFSASVDGSDTTFEGEKIYLWVLRLTDVTVEDPVLSEVSEWGIFSGSGANWTFPSSASPPPLNATLVTTSQVDEASGEASVDGEMLRLAAPGLALTYERWRTEVFPVGFPEEDGGPGADPDRDGLENAVEFGFGTDPLAGNPSGVEIARAGGGGFGLSYWRQVGVVASVVAQFSEDLVNWVDAGAPGDAVESSGGRERIVIAIPRATGGKRFARVTVRF